MSHTKSVIELNGKKYDAVSGKELTAATVHTAAKSAHKPGKSVDGFIKPTTSSARIVQPTHHKPAAAPAAKPASTPARTKPTVSRPASSHAKRTTQPAKTLMRKAVKKPSNHSVNLAAAHQRKPAAIAAVSGTIDQPALRPPATVQAQRLKQATHVSKSPLISRFGSAAPKPVAKRTAHIPVAPVPHHAEPKPADHIKASRSVHPKPAAKSTPAHHSAAQKQIAAALEKADSHKQPKLAKTKRRHKVAHKLGVSSRFVSTAAATLSVLLLIGFFAYQNVPNIAMRMASAKSGFSAKMPGYSPAGFAMNSNVQAAPGIVTISFRSNTDDRAFQISQRPSEWNSESLLSNFVETKNQPYQTFQEAGKTIYLYDGSNATWVSGGVWYQVEGNSDLSNDQLLRIASSL